MINNNFPFPLKYVLPVSSLPDEKTLCSKCDAVPFLSWKQFLIQFLTSKERAGGLFPSLVITTCIYLLFISGHLTINTKLTIFVVVIICLL